MHPVGSRGHVRVPCGSDCPWEERAGVSGLILASSGEMSFYFPSQCQDSPPTWGLCSLSA